MKQKIIIGLVFFLAGIFIGLIIYKNLLVTSENSQVQQTPPSQSQIDEKTQLPVGYSDTDYKIEEVLDIDCQVDIDCITPAEYMMQSRCPFISKCLDSKCTVVCPNVVENK